MIASERRPRFKTITLILLLIVSGAATGFAAPAHDYWMYVGSDTSQGGKGIYAFRFHAATGRVEPAGLAAGRFWQANANASWNSIPRMLSQIRAGWPNLRSVVRGVQSLYLLAAHPNGRYLFASDEFPVYSVTAFRIDPSTGKLTILNSTSSAGNGTLAVDKADETWWLQTIPPVRSRCCRSVPTAISGKQCASSILSVPRRNGGRLPHPHSINLSPDNRFAVRRGPGTRQGVRVSIRSPRRHPRAERPAICEHSGLRAGARHLSFDLPNGRFAWLIEESRSFILTLGWDAAKGVFLPLSTVRTIPADFRGVNATAEIMVHPSGKFLYGSNRGHDSIAVFAIDSATGALTPIEYVSARGSRPLSFAIDPSGRYLFVNNFATQNVIEFQIDSWDTTTMPDGRIT